MNNKEKRILESLSKHLQVENVVSPSISVSDEEKRLKEERLLRKWGKLLGESEHESIVEEAQPEPEVLVEKSFVDAALDNAKTVTQPVFSPVEKQPEIPEKDFVSKSVEILSRTTKKTDDLPVNSNDPIRNEINQLKKTVMDLHHFSSRISQMGGGGEVNLRYLDDVNRSSIADGLYLRYDSATKKFVFDDPVSSPNLLNVASDIIPSTTATYNLGNTSNRWEALYVGPNSITFSDTLNGPDQVLSVANQVFYITQGIGSNTTYNSNAGFNAGGIILQNYNIQLANTSQNLVVGSASVNTSVVFNQNIKANTTITFTDNTVQNTAYKPPNVRIANVISNTVLIDFSTDNFVHIHTNQGTVTANLQNLTAGKVVELFIFNNVGGTQQFNHGVTSTQATGGQSFYLSSHNTMYVKYFCLDGTANNTFVAAIS
jgi:hypothetical protein